MGQSTIADGSFVWTLFPFGPPDPPDRPGPVRRIAFVLAIDTKPSIPQLLLAYTSSGTWRGSADAVPQGVINFSEADAKAVGQKPFHMDLRCLAQVPLTSAWFPDLAQPGNGVVGVAAARLQARIEKMLQELVMRNRDLIQMRGPR